MHPATLARALRYIALVAVLALLGLVVLAFAPHEGDLEATRTTLCTVLVGSVTAIAAIVTHQRPPNSP